jgi:predicted NBD/HSP70 family sugar kinase
MRFVTMLPRYFLVKSFFSEVNLSQRGASGSHVLREINRSAVLNAVRNAPEPLRLTELAGVAAISRPAVGRAVSDLVDRGLIELLDAPSGSQHMGRPAQRARFRSALGYVCGLAVGPRGVRAVLADLSGSQVASRDVSAPPTGTEVLAAAKEGVAACLEAAGVTPRELWAVVVGTPGIVDSETGEVRLAPSIPGWAGTPIVASLREAYSCPVLVDNDMNLAALAERCDGAAQGCADFVYVHWSDRVGAGLVLDGKPYRGAFSAAGELGYLDLMQDLERVPCGPRTAIFEGQGSFEASVSTTAIHQLALRESAAQGVQPLFDELTETGHRGVIACLYEHASAGDPLARHLLRRACGRFAAGLAALLILFDPHTVVIGGSAADTGEPLLNSLTEELATRVFNVPRLVQAQLGEDGVTRGAVHLGLANVEGRLEQACKS